MARPRIAIARGRRGRLALGPLLVKQAVNAVVVELYPDGLSDQLAILSRRTGTVERLDRRRAQPGDADFDRAAPLHQQRRGVS